MNHAGCAGVSSWVGAVDASASLADATDTGDGEATFSDSGDSITTLPDGSVSFSGTTAGGDGIELHQ